MDATASVKPQTLLELLPGLSGILSKDSMQALTAKKQPRQASQQSRTAEKVVPLTTAEMRAHLMGNFTSCEPHTAPGPTSNKKKTWNSSVKVGKTVSITGSGKLKNNPVRKVLNFQPKPKITFNSRATIAPDSPKFTKPEFRAKKSLFSQVHNNVRISGVSKISETPMLHKPIKSRITETPIVKKPVKSLTTSVNKENFSNLSNKKMASTPKIIVYKKQMHSISDTPMSNVSSCDASFLQKEKEINEFEKKMGEQTDERVLENIAKEPTPVSTPFREYRNIQEFFSQPSFDIDNSSTCHENTITCFEKPLDSNENKREESVIVSLCNLLNRATVNSKPEANKELDDLVEIEKQIESSIAALNSIAESQLTSLQYVKKLIAEKTSNKNKDIAKAVTVTDEIPIVVKNKSENPVDEPVDLERSFSVTSVIKSVAKSPSYRIPRKSLCLRKRVFCKSMSNVSDGALSPVKSVMGNRALSMYMKMKQDMNFLSTPKSDSSHKCVPNTPAMTSHNLQEQLNKLYAGNH